jgi:hypothetical protein
MAALPFPQFLKRYGIMLLFAATPNVVPGAVMEKRRKGYFAIGSLKDVLGDTAATWTSKLQGANLVYGTVERQLNLKGKASLNEFGVEIGGGLQRAKSVTFSISGVRARIFVSQSKLTLVPKIHRLRKTDRRMWKQINNNWIADYTYYATEATLEFNVGSGVDLKGEIENRIKLSGNAGVKWKSNRSFTLTRNDAVPFGFSGWRV